jgi:undecaprenyl pyrophosphate phosphatase UppP
MVRNTAGITEFLRMSSPAGHLLLGTIAATVVGLLFEKEIESAFSSPLVVSKMIRIPFVGRGV